MGATPPLGYATVRLIWTVYGRSDQVNVTFGASAIGLNVASAVADTWYDAWTGDDYLIKPVSMAMGWTFQGVEVTQGFGEGAQTGSHLEPIVGSSAIEPLPPNCALLVRKNTAAGGRRGRGRAYFPPCFFGEGSVDTAGNLDQSWITSHQTLFNNSLVQLIASDHKPYLLHENGSTPTAITSLAIQGQMATQRRRLR